MNQQDVEMLVRCLSDIKESDMVAFNDALTSKEPMIKFKDTEAPAPVRKKKRRQKDEIDYLRKRVKEMEEKLVDLRQNSNSNQSVNTLWENEARNQSIKRQKAEQENLLLRKSLEQQVVFAKQLEAVLAQSPSISLFPFTQNEKWKLYHLVADRSKRIEAMNAMADRDYESLSAILLETSLGELNSEFQGMRVNDGKVISLDSNKAAVSKTSFDAGFGSGLEIELLRHYTCADIPFKALRDAYWRVFEGKTHVELTQIQVLEVIDDNLLYIQSFKPHPTAGATKQSNMVFKRYRQKKRDIILWRCVVEDELYPLQEGNIRSTDNGWMILEDRTPLKGAPKVDVRFVVKIRPPMASTRQQSPGVVIETLVGSFMQNAAEIRHVVESKQLLKAQAEVFDDTMPLELEYLEALASDTPTSEVDTSPYLFE